nr:cytochrome P450 2K1-like isoform X2 [Chrysemys picta bellii]
MTLADPIVILLLFVVTFVSILTVKRGWNKRACLNSPPGPRPLPILGNLHQLNLKRPYRTLLELSEKYGPVFSIQMGPKNMVVLSGYKMVKEALVNQADAFAERPKIPIFEKFARGNGIIFAHGENWKVMRRFTLTTLRDFGMGKRTIENKILEECDYLIKDFESHKGSAFDTMKMMNAAVSNVIVSIMLGHRFDYEDPKFLRLIHLINESVRLSGSPMVTLFNMFPALGFLPGNHKTIFNNLEELYSFTEQTFIKHLKQLDPNDQRSFIDAFLIRQQEGTYIIPLLASVLYDKTQWEKPGEFYPQHFLSTDGKFVKNEAFMPFSAGRRICAGETLAKMELFLFFTSLLQRFTFHPPPGVTSSDLDLTPAVGFTTPPMPHKVCAVPCR